MKKDLRIVSILVSIVGTLILFAMSFQTYTCAKFTGASHLRAPIYTYEFTISGINYKGSFYQIDSKLSKDELEKLDCIKIQYNYFIPWVNRVEDIKIEDRLTLPIPK